MIPVQNKRVVARRVLAIFLVFVVAVVVIGAEVGKRSNMSMRCFDLESEELRGRLETLRAKLVLSPDAGMVHVVHIRFDASWVATRGDTFVVHSHRTDRVLYMGPFVSEIATVVDLAMTTDGGYDILNFMLFRPDVGQLCRWSGDLGHPFWGGAKEVSVRLLSDRKFDENGIPQTYEVEFDD